TAVRFRRTRRARRAIRGAGAARLARRTVHVAEVARTAVRVLGAEATLGARAAVAVATRRAHAVVGARRAHPLAVVALTRVLTVGPAVRPASAVVGAKIELAAGECAERRDGDQQTERLEQL